MCKHLLQSVGIGAHLNMAAQLSNLNQRGVRTDDVGQKELLKPSDKISSLRPTMDKLLSQSDYSYPLPQEEREWIDSPSIGKEIF